MFIFSLDSMKFDCLYCSNLTAAPPMLILSMFHHVNFYALLIFLVKLIFYVLLISCMLLHANFYASCVMDGVSWR
jgi:hypothetical protein